MFLKKATLKLKLLASFGIFAAIALSLGVVGYNSLRDVSNIYSVVSTDATPSLNRIYTMNLLGSKMQDAMQSIFLNADAPDIVMDEVIKFKAFREELEALRKIEESKHAAGKMAETTKKLNEVWKNLSSHAENILKGVETGDLTERTTALRLFSTEYTRDMDTFEKYLKEILESQNAVVTQQTEQAKSLVTLRGRWIAILLGIGTLVALIVGYLIARSLGKLVHSVESVTQYLTAGSERLSSSSSELSEASQQLADGANEGASSLEETASSLEELASMVKTNAASASEAAKLSQESSQSASESEAQIQKLTGAMKEMKESSKRIGEIIDVIDDIAFQTNLLALNAAVEAARAGEQGRGFAVVADAVRSLAQRSATAAKDISSLINENMKSTDQGDTIVEKSGIAFKSIITLIKQVAVLNGEIAAASLNQADGLAQINTSMNQLDSIMQNSSVSAEKAAESSQRLTFEATSLKETVNQLNNVITGASIDKDFTNLTINTDGKENADEKPPYSLTGS